MARKKVVAAKVIPVKGVAPDVPKEPEIGSHFIDRQHGILYETVGYSTVNNSIRGRNMVNGVELSFDTSRVIMGTFNED